MDTITLFKILLTPALIWAVSMAGRKWGPAVSGLLIGLPLNSGPIALFIALEHGAAFARQTTTAIILGVIADITFCLAYGWLAALRQPWPVAMAGGWVANILTTLALDQIHTTALIAFAAAAGSLLLLNLLLPRAPRVEENGKTPWWDIPARMVVATAFILALTGLASALGSQLSGLLATLPIYTSILAGFNHHLLGPSAGVRFIRGFAVGLFAFLAFFAVLEPLLGVAPLWLAFVGATVVALAIQAALGWLNHLRAEQPSPTSTSPQPFS